ncbi:hypothetical protein E8E14_002464 [Neopestalotiopsis sp. 37M]|nr:hypothetical protein E8E14_002464 [Neopestalotiopsis sp. 37M]
MSTDKIVVIETASHSETIDKYTTLSHCWGGEGSPAILKLTPAEKDNFTNREHGISWSGLSKNFQEAIQVTRQLGVRYIWIDALCIVQGPGGDFDQEGQLMHRVYRNSFCNLTASDSRDGSGGLFRSRKMETLIPTSIETSDASLFGRSSWLILPSDLWDDHLLGQPLYERGWVFQERILSPRMLHFTEDQVFWDCASMSACEILPDGLPSYLDVTAASERHWRARLQITEEGRVPTGPADDSLERFWKSAVRSYTACKLKVNTDRMTAIWSVAKLVRDEMRRDYEVQDYGAGLWSSRLYAQLAWRVMNPAEAKRPDELKKYPSWSWASLIGEIETQDRGPDKRLYHVVGHDGQPLCFELKGVSNEQRDTAAPGANDLQEELKVNSLPVKAKLFQVTIQKTKPLPQPNNASTSRPLSQAEYYTVNTKDSSLPDIPVPGKSFEVFPDVENFDTNRVFHFFVLDASKVDLGASEMLASEYRSVRSAPTVQGTGLILTKILSAEHELEFNRVAMCRFQGIRDKDWKLLTPESGAGTDIWLT